MFREIIETVRKWNGFQIYANELEDEFIKSGLIKSYEVSNLFQELPKGDENIEFKN